ncbi:WXG100 family type VII secretion target [Actinoallomurus purpureus]|uniref:WXG100 family type VII secretion target n=1 Tax=Actinoallomurus purpureus TaxID=478114 RepID=UPI00209340FB|nr:WXG100 family type VII secretion target [Actinoallomurus purpureus]MCO6006304.1 WXG100 family type VII secretion target [Actinoallomurus purpureus]
MAVDHQTYVIKSGGRPAGAGSYGDAETVKNMIAATQPGKITTAAQAYDAMGTALNDVQTAIYDAAKVLADHWSGPAADAAQDALRHLYGTASELVIRSNETAKSLQWYGGSILPMYKNIKWPKNTSSPAATTAAAQVMKNLNERIAQTWDGMPPQIEKNLPDIPDRGDGPGDGNPGSGTASGSGGGGGTTGGYGGLGRPRVPHSSHEQLPPSRPGGDLSPGKPRHPGGSSGIPSPGGTDLAGAAPVVPHSTSGGLGLGDPLLGGGAGGAPLGSGTGAFGTSGPGGMFVSGTGLPRPGAGRLSIPGESQQPSTGRGSAGVVGRSGGDEAPLASAGGRSDEKERERTTWLAEDRDLWTGGTEAVPDVIGQAPNRFGDSKSDDDELLTIDELQELLDFVDESAEETGEDLSQASMLGLTDRSLFALDAEASADVGTELGISQRRFDVGEAHVVDLDSDVLGLDNDTSRVQRD